MDKQKLLKRIYIDEIETDDAELKDDKIIFRNNYGAENSISIDDIDSNDQMFAWYETSEIGFDKVKIKINEQTTIEWKPPINSMGLSAGCNFFKFHKNYLIVGYRDKSSDMLAFVDLTNFSVKEFYFFGDGYYFKQINNEIHIKNIYENCYNIDFKLIILDNEIIKEPIEKK